MFQKRSQDPITMLPGNTGEAGLAVDLTGAIAVAVALVGTEERPDTWTGLDEMAQTGAWPKLQESVRRRGLEPVGQWAMAIMPEHQDWRDHLGAKVVEQIEGHLAQHPEERVVMVVTLVDTAKIVPAEQD